MLLLTYLLTCNYSNNWKKIGTLNWISCFWSVAPTQLTKIKHVYKPTQSDRIRFNLTHDDCGLQPLIIWTFRPFVSLRSTSGHFRFLVPPSGTTCLSSSHLRRHSRFSDNDSRPFCFPVPTKTLSFDSCVTITIHHYCLDTRGPCND